MSSNTKPSLSYDHGTAAQPLVGLTIGAQFDLTAHTYADLEALVSCHQGIRLTYAQLREKTDLFARGLISMGIVKGDRVGVWSTNNVQWVIAQLATAKIGAILVNINPAYRVVELEYALRQSGIKLLIVMPGFKHSEYLDMVRQLRPQLFGQAAADNLLPDLHHLVVIADKDAVPQPLLCFDDIYRFGQDISQSILNDISGTLQFDDPINIQYTSGTTGLPKGVTLTHHNLLNNALYCGSAMGLTERSRYCVPVPFYHCAGMVLCTLAAYGYGGTLVLPRASFEAESVLSAIQQERCTHIAGVPTMFIAELEHPHFNDYDLTSLEGGFMAGAPCPVKLMKDVATKMHARGIVIFYGQTEASPVITSTLSSDDLELRATSVGRAVPFMEVKIIDSESGAVVPRGVQGELCARGYAIMPGYWNNQKASEDAIDKEHWLHTGDLAVMNERGYVNITGRKKDMIIRGGENVYPREIEEVLATHHLIAQAQVFGVPDERLGEEVAAWIQLRVDAECTVDDIRHWLKERVAHFKVPRYMIFVTDFPMTVTGKVQKFAMREKMVQQLGLQKAENITTA